MCTIKTSSDFLFPWRTYFHNNPMYFRTFADFEADNEIDNSSVGNKTVIVYKQNSVCNGYTVISELEDVLKTDY